MHSNKKGHELRERQRHEEKNPVHIGFEYSEALEAKRDFLDMESSLLKIAKKVDSYKFLRDNELKMKTVLLKKFKEFRSSINQTEKSLPKVAVDSNRFNMEKESESGLEVKETKVKSKGEISIEQQLKEIQRRLEELQGTGA